MDNINVALEKTANLKETISVSITSIPLISSDC